jgi:uncharacterized protein YggE
MYVMVIGGARSGRLSGQDGTLMRGSYAATFASMAMTEMPIHSEGLEVVASVQITYALASR